MNKLINNILHLGLDEIELYCTLPERDDIILEYQRNGYLPIQVGIFIVDYIETGLKGYKYKLLFMKDNLPMFAYYRGRKIGAVYTKDYLCIYSTGLHVLGIDEITKIIIRHFNIDHEHPYISRFDIAVDILLPINEIVSLIKDIKVSGSTFHDETGGIETKYLGRKKMSQNKNSLIRIYDKLKDIKSKEKYSLYSNYLEHDYVTRIEIEVRKNLAQNITLEELVVEDNQKSILANYLGKYIDEFKQLSELQISLYKKIEKEDLYITHRELRKSRKMKMFLGLAKGLLRYNLCPVEELLIKGLHGHKISYLTEKNSEVKRELDKLRKKMKAEENELRDYDKYLT